jgi:Uma2 family endonuclease
MGALENEKTYTYADYASWELKEGERFEIIDGIPYMMSAPSVRHQTISGVIFGNLFIFLRGRKCQVYHAPFDVCLFGDGDNDDTVVQPDILVVCDRFKMDEKRCNGAPDLIVEILSPSTSKRDIFLKFNKYQQAGVREYWVVNPIDKVVSVHVLENNKYITSVYSEADKILVNVLEGCEIDLGEVFAEDEED